LSRLSLALAAGAVFGTAANIIGLSLVRDVLLGITFALWTAWWIWLIVLLVRAPHPVAAQEKPGPLA
jgi:hypothetical protein